MKFQLFLHKLIDHVIKPILTCIFNLALISCQFPDQFKLSEVKPILKRGFNKDIPNFRPVALVCNVSNAVEKALHDRITGYLEKNNRIVNQQFGIQKNKNTELALISFCK